MIWFSLPFEPRRVFVVLVAPAFAIAMPAQAAHASDTAPLCRTSAAGAAAADGEEGFLAESAAAMGRMMADMAVTPTGDVDRDFVAMMVPHHQGAVAMAQAMLRYGCNEQLRRLAQEIIVTQEQEIAVMRHAIGDPPPPSPSPSGHLPMHQQEK